MNLKNLIKIFEYNLLVEFIFCVELFSSLHVPLCDRSCGLSIVYDGAFVRGIE